MSEKKSEATPQGPRNAKRRQDFSCRQCVVGLPFREAVKPPLLVPREIDIHSNKKRFRFANDIADKYIIKNDSFICRLFF